MLKYDKNNLKNAKKMRREMTPWEGKLWLFFLKSYPLHIYRQRLIGNYIVDFYCPNAKIAIELDGSQHYSEENILYDNIRTQKLNELGIKVLRINNNDIDTKFKAVCEYIDVEIQKRKK